MDDLSCPYYPVYKGNDGIIGNKEISFGSSKKGMFKLLYICLMSENADWIGIHSIIRLYQTFLSYFLLSSYSLGLYVSGFFPCSLFIDVQ